MQTLVQFTSVCALYGNGDLLLAGGLLSLNVGEAAPVFPGRGRRCHHNLPIGPGPPPQHRRRRIAQAAQAAAAYCIIRINIHSIPVNLCRN